MEWAPVVIKEIISAFRQQHSSQDSEKLKNIVREVMAENISKEQNKLLGEILVTLNKGSVRNSQEVNNTAMERDHLKEEYEKLSKQMERLMFEDRKMEKKQENKAEPSLKQKMLLEKVNELMEGNVRKGRSRSRHRNGDGDGRLATNQSQRQQQGQSHSHGAISKFKHQASKGKTNPSFLGNANDGSRAYTASKHHPSSFIRRNDETHRSPPLLAFQQHHGTGVSQQQYSLGPGVGQKQYQGAGVGQQQYQGTIGGQQQYQGPGGGIQQYPLCNSQGFLQYQKNPQLYQQNPQLYQQKFQISQSYSSNPGQPYQLHQNDQQHQPQFGSTETSTQYQQFHHRGQFHKGRQFHHRGKFQQRGQLQHRGQFPHQGGFHQQRDNFQPKDRNQITDDESLNQFTAEELNLLKDILKQKKLQSQQEENKDVGLKSQMKPGLKKKQKKKQIKALLNKAEDNIVEHQQVSDSDDHSDSEDDLDEMKQFHSASKAQLEAMAVQDAQGNTTAEESTTQNITCADEAKKSNITCADDAEENKEETATETPKAFELCIASGLDISKLQEGPEWDGIMSNMVLVAKSGGQTATCQPKTLSEMVEFKKKYPNTEVIVLK